MKDLKNFSSIFMCINPIDFRKGAVSLSSLVQGEFNTSPFNGDLFLFTNKKRDGIKALYWDKTGFALWSKTLDKEKYPWPKKIESKKIILTQEEIDFILKGVNPWKLKKHTALEYSLI